MMLRTGTAVANMPAFTRENPMLSRYGMMCVTTVMFAAVRNVKANVSSQNDRVLIA
jgi:hypothetical protein